ncbi:hypothetical protein LCM08_03955 [Salipiger pacificus]|nr:hypothetical protein [Alloyangia pacifica]MCA0944058.1 hypothetical protein [Alloyangia pacifica]
MRQPGALGGIIPPSGQLLDFTEVRALEGMRRSQGLLSIVMVAGATLAIWTLKDVPLLLPWLGVMLLCFGVHSYSVHALPEQGYRRQLLLPIATLLLSGIAYIAGGMILWAEGEPSLRTLSLLFIFVALLNTLTYRVRMRLLLVLDLALMGAGVLARAGWLWIVDPGTADTLLVSVALVICYLFFVRVAWTVMRTREALDLASGEALAAARGRAMEQLTGGVAHDFNNLLTAVLGNMELARLSPVPAEREELMDEAERAARRGAELTAQLLAMASCARLKPVSMSPEEALRGLPERAAEQLGSAHDLTVELEPELPDIRVDGPNLQICLLELISNARDAMPDGGVIALRVNAAARVQVPGVCFELSDTGAGIPADLMPLVCEPYFTTKPVGQGSGLGLAMLRGFAEQSGGDFELGTPRSGLGTCACLWFPAVADQAKAGPGPTSAGPRPKAARAASPAE